MPSLGSGLGSGLISFAVSQLLGGVVSSVSGATAWLLDQVGQTLDATTEVQLKGGWFGGHVVLMGELAGVLVLPLVLVAAGHAIVRQDPGLLLRVVLVQLPLAVLLSAAAVELIQLSLDWVDQVSGWLAGAPGHTGLKGALDQLAGGLSPGGPSGVTPMLVSLLSEAIMGVGAFALFLELAVRGAAIYLAVLFVPMVIAGLVWPVTARFGRRLAETIAALVLSKLVMVGALSLAAGAVTGGLVRGELASVVDGVALLLLAVFAPYSLLRLLPFIEAGAMGHLEGAGHRLVTGPVGLSARMAGALSGASEVGRSGENGPGADAFGPPDHPGSGTPSHLEAILGSGPGARPGGGSWPEPPEPFGPPGEGSPPPHPAGNPRPASMDQRASDASSAPMSLSGHDGSLPGGHDGSLPGGHDGP